MPDSLLALFKFCLLAVLYLFFARVLWAVWSEVRGPKPDKAAKVAAAAPTTLPAPQKQKAKKAPTQESTRLVVSQPTGRRGTTFGLGAELTVGRAPGCQISLPDDTFMSQLHARIFQRGPESFVDDLGSTNGSFVNGTRVTAPTILRKGDSLQVGSTVLEVK